MRARCVLVEQFLGGISDTTAELIATVKASVDLNADGYIHTAAASVRVTKGAMHTGLNVFHFTGGPCAELAALGAACAGGARQLEAIVAVGDGGRGVLAPCGRCRQVLADLHESLRVIVPTERGLAAMAARELLPCRFTVPSRKAPTQRDLESARSTMSWRASVMANAGDRVRLRLSRGTDREGTVIGVTGSLLRVRWSSEEETSVVPAPGTLSVLGRAAGTAGKASRPGKKKAAGSKKATGTRTSANKKAIATKAPAKKGGAMTRVSAGTKLTGKAPSKKSSGTTSDAGPKKNTAAAARGEVAKKAAKGTRSRSR